MTNEYYEDLEAQFCAENDQNLRDILKLRYSELKEKVRKDRSFKDFIDRYMRPPIFIAVIALCCVYRDILQWTTFLTIIVSEVVILCWLWAVWSDETTKLADQLFGEYECQKAVQEYLLDHRASALQSAEDTAHRMEIDDFFTISMRELPCRYSSLFYRKKL